MANAVTLNLGNWGAQVGVGLRDALAVSINVMGRTGEQACKHALILMAQSAAKLSKGKSRAKNRRIQKDEHGKFVEVYTQKRREPRKVYDWMFSDSRQERIDGTWENAKRIGNKGLAARSWLWGLKRLGGKPKSAPISGTSKVYTIRGKQSSGYVKDNRLSYIHKAMPTGWESQVAQLATNKIMKQAAMKTERKWKSAMRRKQKQQERTLQSFFKLVVA